MIKKILGVVATAALALGATSANATSYAVTYQGSDTYIGSFAAVGDSAIFGHTALPASSFTEVWVFQLANPLGTVINVNYQTSAGLTGFAASLYSLTGTPVCTTTCTGVVTGASQGAFSPAGPQNYQLSTAGLASGYYAYVFSGTSDGVSGNSYSGNFAVTAPEPATLGLFGLGLAAVGFVRRRRLAA